MTWVGGVDTYIKYQYGNEFDSAVSRVESRVKSLAHQIHALDHGDSPKLSNHNAYICVRDDFSFT